MFTGKALQNLTSSKNVYKDKSDGVIEVPAAWEKARRNKISVKKLLSSVFSTL